MGSGGEAAQCRSVDGRFVVPRTPSAGHTRDGQWERGCPVLVSRWKVRGTEDAQCRSHEGWAVGATLPSGGRSMEGPWERGCPVVVGRWKVRGSDLPSPRHDGGLAENASQNRARPSDAVGGARSRTPVRRRPPPTGSRRHRSVMGCVLVQVALVLRGRALLQDLLEAPGDYPERRDAGARPPRWLASKDVFDPQVGPSPEDREPHLQPCPAG
jgi:hypothetical protein